ncbi:hypothetical protein BD324DRAFT_417547 [Kockovaella imperatae]|uniref:GST C-terminal domain-containing protein n=1 Tax=Kockovaella imperatae TaxID=4999 RepID=A0A1Y1UIZ3_9TREE|nr:hypothetical protein BD324DRAFT_417547 [Kockovaella imperatae]ORX38033.1 hypothetical protein BD324DRAFT_417547 [Kockovaella imperatae]
MERHIIFYDLTKKDPVHAWVMNAWKSRLVLNFLELEYETRFLDFPDVESTLMDLGLPPSAQGQRYAVPAITILSPDTSEPVHAMGEGTSKDEVAAALQALVQEKKLYLESPELEEVTSFTHQIMETLRPIWMPAMLALLTPRSAERFSSRKLALAREKADQEEAWKIASGYFQRLGEVLKRHEGPFVLGDRVSYADFIIVAQLQFLRVADMSIYDRFVIELPGLKELYERCRPWTVRDT